MALEEEPYTDLERSLLQFIVSVGSVNADFLNVSVHKKFRSHIEKEEKTPLEEIMYKRSIETSIDLINEKLHLVGYKVVKIISQVSADPYYVYVNTVSDEPSKISITRSPKDISIVKKIIEHIICENDDESFSINERDALKFCSFEGYTGAQGLHFLRSLVNEGWLNVTDKARYYLSIRSIAELKPMLINKYGIKTLDADSDGLLNACTGCRDLVTIGVRCNNDACNVRFHKHCQEYYARANGSQCPNPTCNVDWSNASPSIVGVSRI